jgi:hypothetical protein
MSAVLELLHKKPGALTDVQDPGFNGFLLQADKVIACPDY